MIRKHRRQSAHRIEIAQRRNYGLSCFRIWRHRADDPVDRLRIIGIDQEIVLDIQQWSALQLAGQPAAISQIFVQPARQQRQRVAVPDLGRGAKPFVKRHAKNAVVVDQRERFVRDDFLELIFGRARAGDLRAAGFRRNVIDPVPPQGMIVDLEFSRRCLDRRAGREEPLDAHALKMVTTLAAPGPRTFLSRHWLSPSLFIKYAGTVPCNQKSCLKHRNL